MHPDTQSRKGDLIGSAGQAGVRHPGKFRVRQGSDAHAKTDTEHRSFTYVLCDHDQKLEKLVQEDQLCC